MKPRMTKEIAYAAGHDAGDRSMRAAGRRHWNEPDFDAAWAEYARLWPVERDLEESREAQAEAPPRAGG